MRRNLSRALLLAAVPVGVAVGLLMALRTSLPYCPVVGLGTRELCAPQPTFRAGLCILCGIAAAAVLFVASLSIRRRAAA